jgi:transcriptional regulator with XRE-family HTH domain
MARRSRRAARWEGLRESNAIAANLGRNLRATRRHRRLTQAQLADRVGLSQSGISALEAGNGGRTSLETWIAIGIALARPISVGFTRDTVQPLNDAGHLAAQELVARIATTAGWRVAFEAPDDPARRRAQPTSASTARPNSSSSRSGIGSTTSARRPARAIGRSQPRRPAPDPSGSCSTPRRIARSSAATRQSSGHGSRDPLPRGYARSPQPRRPPINPGSPGSTSCRGGCESCD